MMQYDSLFNNPLERRRVTYPFVWWDNAFSSDELNKICGLCEREPLDQATIYGQRSDDGAKEIRRSKVKFIEKTDDTTWIFTQLNLVAQSLNNQFYNFNLNEIGRAHV